MRMLGTSRGWLRGVGEGVGEDVGGHPLRDGEPGGPSRERRAERRRLGSADRPSVWLQLGKHKPGRWKACPCSPSVEGRVTQVPPGFPGGDSIWVAVSAPRGRRWMGPAHDLFSSVRHLRSGASNDLGRSPGLGLSLWVTRAWGMGEGDRPRGSRPSAPPSLAGGSGGGCVPCSPGAQLRGSPLRDAVA